MYSMPGEVLKAERPGCLMFSLTQILAGVGAFFLAPSLGLQGPALFIAVALVVLLVRRARGLYLAEQALYWLRAMVRSVSDEGRAGRLDPAQLYQIQEVPSDGNTSYLVKTPDGRVMTVKG